MSKARGRAHLSGDVRALPLDTFMRERGTELGHPKGDRKSQLEKAIVKQLIDRCRL